MQLIVLLLKTYNRLKNCTLFIFNICCALQKEDPSGFIKSILYSTFDGNEATHYGHSQEPVLEEWLIKDLGNVEIMHVGLVAHKKFKFIAGSPDGIGVNVQKDERFLIEYKAPFGLFTSKTSIFDAPTVVKGFFLAAKDGIMTLRKRHDYYFQIQGLLEICDLPYCLLVVGGFESVCCVRVERDRELFENVMLERLRKFYFGAVLPERAYAMKRRGGLRTSLVSMNVGEC